MYKSVTDASRAVTPPAAPAAFGGRKRLPRVPRLATLPLLPARTRLRQAGLSRAAAQVRRGAVRQHQLARPPARLPAAAAKRSTAQPAAARPCFALTSHTTRRAPCCPPQLAPVVGADWRDLVPVVNATGGVNAVVNSLRLTPGDVIIMANTTYPAVRGRCGCQYICSRAAGGAVAGARGRASARPLRPCRGATAAPTPRRAAPARAATPLRSAPPSRQVRSALARAAARAGASLAEIEFTLEALSDEAGIVEAFASAARVATAAGGRAALAVVDHCVSFPPVVMPVKGICDALRCGGAARVMGGGAAARAGRARRAGRRAAPRGRPQRPQRAFKRAGAARSRPLHTTSFFRLMACTGRPACRCWWMVRTRSARLGGWTCRRWAATTTLVMPTSGCERPRRGVFGSLLPATIWRER